MNGPYGYGGYFGLPQWVGFAGLRDWVSLIVYGDECVGRQLLLWVSMSYYLSFLRGCETYM